MLKKKSVSINELEKDSWLAQKTFAKERTILSVERNSLAYIRTGFSAFVLGIAFIKLFDEDIFFVKSGIVALIAGVLFICLGIALYFIRNRKIKSL
jgi:uncharacterized membrane protein YidH (DUF202 family)